MDELLSDRCNYCAFIADEDEINYEDEAKKILNVGHFNSYIGDLMPYAMANVLHVSIVLIPVDVHTPVMYVTPNEVTSRGTIFLVYTPHTLECLGHYDAAASIPTQKRGLSMKQSSFCSSGVNSSATGRKSCIPQPMYANRDVAATNTCGVTCCCKNCANPHGVRPAKADKKRVQRPHNM